MKKIIATLSLSLLTVMAFAQLSLDANGPAISFQEESHDFGDITEGDKVSHTFTFTNTGTAPLIISDVKTTCGCTASDWPKEPVMPGKTADITVSFNSRGKYGRQNKVITIISNAVTPQARISVSSNVLKAGR